MGKKNKNKSDIGLPKGMSLDEAYIEGMADGLAGAQGLLKLEGTLHSTSKFEVDESWFRGLQDEELYNFVANEEDFTHEEFNGGFGARELNTRATCFYGIYRCRVCSYCRSVAEQEYWAVQARKGANEIRKQAYESLLDRESNYEELAQIVRDVARFVPFYIGEI